MTKPFVEIDDDTLQAVINHWNTDKTTLPTLFPTPPRMERLKQDKPGQAKQIPFVGMKCELDKNESAGTAGAWHDYRTVTMELWGMKANVTKAAPAILSLFNLQTQLGLPSGDKFMQWWPLGGMVLKEDKDTFQGGDVWVGEIKARVWSIRVY